MNRERPKSVSLTNGVGRSEVENGGGLRDGEEQQEEGEDDGGEEGRQVKRMSIIFFKKKSTSDQASISKVGVRVEGQSRETTCFRALYPGGREK
jgi:hypothetical protein